MAVRHSVIAVVAEQHNKRHKDQLQLHLAPVGPSEHSTERNIADTVVGKQPIVRHRNQVVRRQMLLHP